MAVGVRARASTRSAVRRTGRNGRAAAERRGNAVVRRAGEAEPEAPAAPPAAGDDKPKIDREDPALAEKFAVIGAGEAECKACAYLYSPARGDPEYPVMKGTLFKDLPDDWTCPTCGAEKQFFSPIEKTVAGFASNQGYGFGTNTMTEGEKSVLIYGALAFFFGLFIAGYLLD